MKQFTLNTNQVIQAFANYLYDNGLIEAEDGDVYDMVYDTDDDSNVVIILHPKTTLQ